MVPELSYLNLLLSTLLFLWPSGCPDLACPGPQTIEVIPQSIKDSLDFAHSAARECSASSRRGLTFSGFWLGFLLGVFATMCLTSVTYLCYRLLVRTLPATSPSRAITSGNLRLAQQAALPSAPLASLGPAEARPATPADLRALGSA
jgi:hypothetical protein